jgi:MFS family permease
MLGFAAFAQFMSGPGQSFSVAAFKEPMRAGLGVSETNYSIAYGLATLISGLSLPMTGRLLDRIGARRLLPMLALGLGIGCFAMSRVDGLWGLGVGFTMIRCLGQGGLTLVGTWLIGEWFLRRRGFATSLAGVGMSLSVMTFPLLNGWLLEHYGWRTAWQVLGVLVAGSLTVPCAVWLRNRPEDLGLLPDGDGQQATTGATRGEAGDGATAGGPRESVAVHDDSWTLSEVLRDASFWKLLSVPMCAGMIGTGMVFHQVSILGARGISASAALGLISVQAVVAAVAALGAGWLTDLWRSERLLAMAMGLLAFAVFAVWWMPHAAFAVVFAVAMGLHSSILQSTGTVVWVNYYGRKHQGAIRGVALAMMVLAAAVGPLPIALARDYASSETPALALFVVLPLMAAALVTTSRQPKRRP